MRARLFSHGLMLTAKDRFSTAYSRQIEKKSHMRGQPKPPGMSYSLAIYHNDIWSVTQFLTSRQNQGTLSKRQEARNVGECNLTFGDLYFDHVKLGIMEHYHRPPGYALRIRRGYVNASNKAGVNNFVLGDYLSGQFRLYFLGLDNAHLPPV
jgi:hypothetical protein